MGDAGRRERNDPPRGAAPRAGERKPPVRPGERVAHYQILAELGRGGMGIIFRARDSRLDRDVALKCPWPALAADPVIRERFMREARSASQLSHPHVVPIFEILKWGGLPWLAMELVEGSSLRAVLRDHGPLTVRQTLQAAEGLGDALRAAHAKSIIHRDINPNNILIRSDGWPLLTDFGLAHVFQGVGADPSATTLSEALTEPGHVIGTPGYMSPEQVMGRPLDPRTDIFSFGAVVYEMCTARRAFEASDVGPANEAVLHKDPVPISRIIDSLPEELERIVRKALAKRPEDRYQDARELTAELGVLRRRVESAEYLAAPAHRARILRSVAVWSAGLAVVVVAAATTPWLPRFGPRGPAFAGGTPHQVTSDPAAEAEPAISPDGGLIAYASIAGEQADIWVTDPKGESRLRLTDDAATDSSPAWFPDGSALAFVSDRGGEKAIWRVPRLGGSPVLLVPNAVDPALSPDGRRLAFARPAATGFHRIGAVDLEEPSRLLWMTTDSDGQRDHLEPAWSPDGTTICYADARNLWVVGRDGGRPRRLTDDNAVDLEPVWSSDGRFVVFSSYREGTLAIWRVPAEGGPVQRLTAGTGPESHPTLSLDGSRLGYSTYLDDYDVVLLNLATGKKELIQSLLYESAPTIAPDASSVVFASSRRSGRHDLWVQAVSDGRPLGVPRQLTDLPGTVNTPALSPDGEWVAFKREMGDRADIWVTAVGGGLPERFSEGPGNALHPAWSPDSANLAYVLELAGKSHVWAGSIRQGRRAGPLRQLTSGDTTDHLPAWSWDGGTIAYVSRGRKLDELRSVPAHGGAARLIATGLQVGRLRWGRPTGWLWFSAASARGKPQLWKVLPNGVDPVPAVRPELFAEAAPGGDFDLSADGRLLAFTGRERRGDVWLFESSPGAY